MVVGCYVLDLYCDGLLVPRVRFGLPGHDGNPAQYTGRTKREAMLAARGNGWIVRGDRAICRKHRETGEPKEESRG